MLWCYFVMRQATAAAVVPIRARCHRAVLPMRKYERHDAARPGEHCIFSTTRGTLFARVERLFSVRMAGPYAAPSARAPAFAGGP